MKKTFLVLGITFVVLPVMALAANLDYTPLEPLSPGTTSYQNIGSYLNAAYSVLLTLGALFAVVTFTIGGVVYMTSDAVGVKSAAVERMKAALWGLLLLAASVLILQTINPDLLQFDLLQTSITKFQGPNTNPGGGGTQQQTTYYYCNGGRNAGSGNFIPGSSDLQNFTTTCENGGGRVSTTQT